MSERTDSERLDELLAYGLSAEASAVVYAIRDLSHEVGRLREVIEAMAREDPEDDRRTTVRPGPIPTEVKETLDRYREDVSMTDAKLPQDVSGAKLLALDMEIRNLGTETLRARAWAAATPGEQAVYLMEVKRRALAALELTRSSHGSRHGRGPQAVQDEGEAR